jgi:formamidopyrimidine-DNA glycosylase
VPELPEVEFGRRVAESVAADRRIERVRCDADDLVFDGVRPATVSRRLRGRTVKAVRRRGKHIWFELDTGPHPLFHFGMTGAFRVPGSRPLPLESGPRAESDTWPPRFWKIRMWFDDGGELAMTNARRLGRIRLRDDPAREAPIGALGFDPLVDLPSPIDFCALLERRRTVMKGLLLDQGFAAGVGNWIADEVLYQARIDPRRRADTLTRAEGRRVRAALRRIVERAVAVDAVKKRYPRTWLFHRRWGRQDGARTARGEAIEHITIAGRTTAWVPTVQR